MKKSKPAAFQRSQKADNEARKKRMGKKGGHTSVFRGKTHYFGIDEDPLAGAVGIGQIDGPPGLDIRIRFSRFAGYWELKKPEESDKDD